MNLTQLKINKFLLTTISMSIWFAYWEAWMHCSIPKGERGESLNSSSQNRSLICTSYPCFSWSVTYFRLNSEFAWRTNNTYDWLFNSLDIINRSFVSLRHTEGFVVDQLSPSHKSYWRLKQSLQFSRTHDVEHDSY